MLGSDRPFGADLERVARRRGVRDARGPLDAEGVTFEHWSVRAFEPVTVTLQVPGGRKTAPPPAAHAALIALWTAEVSLTVPLPAVL